MIACSFIASHRCVKNALGLFLTFLLLLFPFVALAHPLPQAPKQARPLVSAPSKPAPQPKSVSQLKVGDVIRARDRATGKVEWKQVIHASKRTVPSLLSVRLADARTGRPAETLVCPLDQAVKLIDGSAIPAGRLAIGKSIVTRAGPVCKVKAMFLLRKPGGFVLCDVRIGSLSAANARLLALSQERQQESNVSFADYKVPASRMAYATPNSSGGGTFNPFLFQGQQYDPATGDYYLRARYYDPTIGRFLSQDPLAGSPLDPISLHRYLYASNDPVNRIDPSGQEGELTGSLAAIGGIATIAGAEAPAVVNAIEEAAPVAEAEATNAIAEITPVIEEATPAVEGEVGQVVSEGEFIEANEYMSERAAAYQEQITGLSRGQVYKLGNVKFDGFKDNVLLDAKGPGYAKFVANDGLNFKPFWRGAEALVDEAQRQTVAAAGRPIEWHIAEQKAYFAIQFLLQSRGFANIKVIFTAAAQ